MTQEQKKVYMRDYNKEYRKRKGPELSAKKLAWKNKKSIKDNAPVSGMVLGPYKTPLRKVKDGFGYLGALTFDTRGKIQCHICGSMYNELGFHARQHGLDVASYKEKFMLSPGTSLISEAQREARKLQAFKNFGSLTWKQKEARKKKSMRAWRKWFNKHGGKVTRLSLETKNKRGICPDQLLELIRRVKVEQKKVPSLDDFVTFYKTQRYNPPIRRTFGSWSNAVRAAGYTPYIQRGSPKGIGVHRWTGEELLAMLVEAHETTGKIPSASDCRRGFLPDLRVFNRKFGSFPEARKAAGIPDFV